MSAQAALGVLSFLAVLELWFAELVAGFVNYCILQPDQFEGLIRTLNYLVPLGRASLELLQKFVRLVSKDGAIDQDFEDFFFALPTVTGIFAGRFIHTCCSSSRTVLQRHGWSCDSRSR